MEESLRLGRVAGIQVGLNWSVLVVFWLVAWSLAVGVFPAWLPGEATDVYWVAGLASAVLFLLSLLTHEMGHALLARRYGVQVEGITLWLFGGVAKLRGDAHTPGAELRIAAIGPAISVALAAAFGLAALVLGGTRPAGAAAAWLALMNAILAGFNLVPAFPLDGGRVLRATLWRRRGDKLAATRTAAAAGRWFGYLLIVLGVAEFFFTAAFGGLWLVFLGWFLLGAARAEESAALLSIALKDVRVADVMSRDPVVVPATITVSSLIDDFVMRHRFSTFPVLTDSGEVMGLVTLPRVKELPPDRRPFTQVGEIACPLDQVAQAHPDEDATTLLSRMQQCSEGRALVFDHGRLVGIVSPTDLGRILGLAGLRGDDRSGAASLRRVV